MYSEYPQVAQENISDVCFFAYSAFEISSF